MFSSTRLALALAAIGLAAPAAANDGAPPVLANAALDALTASTFVPAASPGVGFTGGSALAVDASGPVQHVASRRGLSRLMAPDRAGEGLGPERGPLASAAPSAASVPGDAASASRSAVGASLSRTVTARSPDSVGTASAAASRSGLSSISVAAQSAPGFSSSLSRSASVSSR